MEAKKCARCGAIKELESFRFLAATNCRQAWCRPCENASIRQRYKERRTCATFRAKMLTNAARARAKKKNISFDISAAWVEAKLRKGICEATGIPFELLNAPGRHPFAPSLDQVNAGEGYTKSNVRVVVWCLNQMRANFPDETVRYVASLWLKHSA